MSFEVILHPQAAKFFRKLPLEEQNRVKIRLNELKSPFKIPSVKLKGRKSVYRTRVGQYRILFIVQEDKALVIVLKIDKRSRAYKR